MSSDNRQVFDRHYSAANFRTRPGDYFHLLNQLRLDWIRQLASDGPIVDLGCGSGEYLGPLQAEGHEVIGVDFSRGLLSELAETWDYRARGAGPPKLLQADGRAFPLQNGSIAGVFSFATLAYIPDVGQVIAECHRVLRPGGWALLELGNKSSLNDIEARRTSTGVQCFHLTPFEMRRMIKGAGFSVEGHRAFQLFPVYGGGTSRARNLLNPLLRQLLSERVQKKMLDEHISSSPILRDWAFRQIFQLRKEEKGRTPDSEGQVIPDVPRQSPETDQKRQEACSLMKAGEIHRAVEILVERLRADPSDVHAALELMRAYDGQDEQRFVQGCSESSFEPASVKVSTESHLPRKLSTTATFNPKVSVVLPTFNDKAMLPASILSVLQQTYTDFELIVVDDGSTDGTQGMLATISDPRVKTIVHEENRRLPAALNTGMSAARGEYLTWTSADNICAPFFLDALVGALEAFPDAGMAYADFYVIDSLDRIIGRISVPDLSYRTLLVRNEGNAAFIYRRSAAEAVGKYNEALEGAEDWDYWLRLSERFAFVHVPEAIYYYRLHGVSMQSTLQDKVNQSAQRMISEALERCQGRLDIDALYPAIQACDDPDQARLGALFDLGTRLLRPRVRIQGMAAAVIKQVVEESPQSREAGVHLAIADAHDGKWNAAYDRARQIGDGSGDAVGRLCEDLLACCQELYSAGLDQLTLIPSEELSPELFEKERAMRKTCSMADRRSPQRSAPNPAPQPTGPYDVVLLGYPKCGNTWVQVMLRKALVMSFKLSDDWLPRILGPRSSMPGGVPAVHVTHNMPGFNTERHDEMEIDNAPFSGTRAIVLIRDPRDALVSLYMHNVYREKHQNFSGTSDEMVVDPVYGIDKFIKYYQAMDRDRGVFSELLLVKYEDLIEEPGGMVRKLLRLLELPDVSDGLVDAVVKFGSFENMRRMEVEDILGLSTLAPSPRGGPNAFKVRKGQVGGWTSELSSESAKIIVSNVRAGLPAWYGYEDIGKGTEAEKRNG